MAAEQKIKRKRFSPRQFLLRSSRQVELVIAALRNAPLDEQHPLECVIREFRMVRTLEANARYWVMLSDIAEQAWFDGRQYSAESWHEYHKRHTLPDVVVVKGGEVRSKWIDEPGGGRHVVSTTELESRCFSDYMQAVEVCGAEMGVQFSLQGELSK